MADESLKKFAEELKSLREKKAISLNEIYDKTRIDVKYLNEIENGNFDVLPEVYVRAFLKKYAEMIELDSEEILSKYDIAKGENSEEVTPPKFKKIELDLIKDEETSKTFDDIEDEIPDTAAINKDDKKKNIYMSALFILVSLAAVILYLIFFNDGSEEIIIEKPIDEIISERAQEENGAKIEVAEDNSEQIVPTTTSLVTRDSLSLRINAIDTSWMRVMIDNKFNDEFTLSPSLSKSFRAKSNFSILIGNAGGVELVLNGKKLPKIGKIGEIKNIKVDMEGIHYMKNK